MRVSSFAVPGYQLIDPAAVPQPRHAMDPADGVARDKVRIRARRQADGLDVELTVIDCRDQPASTVMRDVALRARVRHEHLVRVYDVIPLDMAAAAGPATSIAVATEPIDGPTLPRVLQRVGRLTPGQAATALAPIATALGALHSAGVVHGRLTATSVCFDHQGRPYLWDLACAHPMLIDAGSSARALASVAPEVREGMAATPDTDVYGLGVLLRECIAGDYVALDAGTDSAAAPGSGDPAGIDEAASRAIAVLADLCCAHDPAERPTIEEFSRRLLDAVRTEPVPIERAHLGHEARDRGVTGLPLEGPAGPRGAGGGAGGEGAGTGRDVFGRRKAKHRRRSRGRMVAVGAAGAILLGASAMGAQHLWFGVQDGAGPSPVVAQAAAVVPAVDGAPGDVPEHTATDSVTVADGGETTTSVANRAPTEEVVAALIDARAIAWNSGDIEKLTESFMVGSPALEADLEELGGAITAGYVFDDMAFTVTAVTPVESSPVQPGAAGAAVTDPGLRFAVELHADRYQVVGGAGEVAEVPAEIITTVVELRTDDDQQWRIWAWE